MNENGIYYALSIMSDPPMARSSISECHKVAVNVQRTEPVWPPNCS